MDGILALDVIGKSMNVGVLGGEKLVELDIIPIESE
jgi:hypothetical protein